MGKSDDLPRWFRKWLLLLISEPYHSIYYIVFRAQNAVDVLVDKDDIDGDDASPEATVAALVEIFG